MSARLLFLTVLFCLVGTQAQADTDPAPLPNWSVAAGLSFPVAGSVLLGGQLVNTSNGSSTASFETPNFNFVVPGGTLLAERRLKGNTWLMLSLTVSGNNFTGDAHGDAAMNGNVPTTSSSLVGLTASLGIRRVFFSWSRIMVSWFLVASYSYQTTTSSSTTSFPDGGGSTDTQTIITASQAWGVGGAAGLQFDVVLIENVLMLQLGSPLVNLSYAREFTQTRSTQTNGTPLGGTVSNSSTDNGGISGGLAFSPTLALRMLF